MTYTYPVLERYLYLNTSGIGLIPEEHMEAANEYNLDLLQNGSMAFERWRAENYPRLRTLVSKFVGCKESELAFLPNYSFGLVALMPILNRYKKVLLYRDDYPSLRDPFVLHGFDVTWIESPDGFHIDEDEIKKSLLENGIKLLVMSHVQFLSGYCIGLEDLGKFCSENGITFIVDATQSLGRVPIDFDASGMDIMISSNYKWMNSGFGSGVLCIKEKFLEENPAKVAGYGSYIFSDEGFVYKPSILSYEGGHLNCSGLNILEASIKQKNQEGLDNQIAKAQQILVELIDGLKGINHPFLGGANHAHRAGIVCIPGNEDVFNHLKKNNVVVTFRNGHFRLGPHFYNSSEEIERFIGILEAST